MPSAELHAKSESPSARLLVLLLFFFSGVCGLVYEVVWTRMMTHVFGTTALAVGTVLAAFMSGLALGSWLLGRWADERRNPLRFYAQLELGVGLSALLAHFLLERISPAYLALYEALGQSDAVLASARFIMAFGLVLAPTVLMGATLPVLARFVVTRLSTVGSGLSTLYTINVLGAVGGALLAGFVLIGTLGIHGSVYSAVAGNLVIGAVAWIASRRLSTAPPEESEQDESEPNESEQAATSTAESAPDRSLVSPRTYRLLLGGLAISGMTSFAYEIYWTRSLVFLLGNSTYAVTTMLAAFLSGLAFGGYLIRFIVDRVGDRVALFAWIQIMIGLVAALALPLLFAISDPDRIRVLVGASTTHASDLIATRFGYALLLMWIPATLIGTTFPLMGRIGVSDLAHTGSTVGRIYAVNTVGNVVGALLPGLILIEWFGIQRGILGMATLNALVGLTVLVARPARASHKNFAVAAALVLVAVGFAQVPLDFQFPSESQTSEQRVLFYREGPSATTKVLVDPATGERAISVDGIEIGGNTFTEYKQVLLAHLPKLLVGDVSTELSIGMGSGMLVGESARHGRVASITAVEIEPSVVEGAYYFARENHDVLASPKLRVEVDDIANFLRTSRARFSVISADEKTAQDYASNGFSYSREYYELLLERLSPEGVVVQWVPTTLPHEQYRMVLRTFASAFPEVQLWYFLPAFKDGAVNTILVGSHRRIALDLEAMQARLDADPTAFEGLANYGLTSAESVLTNFIAHTPEIRANVSSASENTLAHPRYEFFSPEAFAVPRSARHRVNHLFLMRLREHSSSGMESAGRMPAALAAEEEFLKGFQIALDGGSGDDAFGHFEASLELAPWNDNLRARLFLAYWEVGLGVSEQGDRERALLFMQHALQIYERNALARVTFARLLLEAGEAPTAAFHARKALEFDPALVAAKRLLEQL